MPSDTELVEGLRKWKHEDNQFKIESFNDIFLYNTLWNTLLNRYGSLITKLLAVDDGSEAISSHSAMAMGKSTNTLGYFLPSFLPDNCNNAAAAASVPISDEAGKKKRFWQQRTLSICPFYAH